MTPREKKNTVQIRVFIPPDVYDDMKEEADSKGTTISGLTRMILIEHHDKRKEGR